MLEVQGLQQVAETLANQDLGDLSLTMAVTTHEVRIARPGASGHRSGRAVATVNATAQSSRFAIDRA
jgi:hypothetical protein